jgi:hypothetical protein
LDDDDRQTLETYCETGSLRRADGPAPPAPQKRRPRLDQISKTVGSDLTGPFRARLPLTIRRLGQRV